MEEVRKKDYKGHNGLENVEDPLRMLCSQFKSIPYPSGIPVDVWLRVAQMKHLLELKKMDLSAKKMEEERNRERRNSFTKDILDPLNSILPIVSDAVGRHRTLSESEFSIVISGISDIVQSFIKNIL